MEEDEDVVFENSCLHQYMKEVGVLDVHVEPLVKYSSNTTTVLPQLSHQSWSFLSSIFAVVKSCLSLPYAVGLRMKRQQDMLKSDRLVQTILNCRLLQDEDVRFLKSVLPPPAHAADDKMFMICAPIFTAVMSYILYHYPSVWITFPMGLSVCGAVAYLRWNILWNSELACIEEFIEISNTFTTLLKKCVRFIQETEVVAHGYTGLSGKGLVTRLEMTRNQPVTRQCPQLRKHLFLTTRECIGHLRSATSYLIREQPLCEDVDINLMCGISLEEYGQCMTETDGAVLMECTDDFSLTSIKAMVHLCMVHVSEFLHRVALCYIPEVQRCPSDFKSCSIIDGISQIKTSMSGYTTLLQRQFNYHWSGFIEESPEVQNVAEKSDSTIKGLHTLNLHLRHIFLSGQDLEKRLTEAPSGVGQESMKSEMMAMKSKLDTCLACLDDCLTTSGQLPPNDVTVKQPAAMVTPIVNDNRQPVSLQEMGDPVIEDQVFEGHTDDLDEDCHYDYDMLEPLDKEKRKRDKQEALRLLHELKSVISVRALDREIRERRAIERQTGVKLKSTPSRIELGTCDVNGGDVTTNNVTNREQDDVSDNYAAPSSDSMHPGVQDACDVTKDIVTNSKQDDVCDNHAAQISDTLCSDIQRDSSHSESLPSQHRNLLMTDGAIASRDSGGTVSPNTALDSGSVVTMSEMAMDGSAKSGLKDDCIESPSEINCDVVQRQKVCADALSVTMVTENATDLPQQQITEHGDCEEAKHKIVTGLGTEDMCKSEGCENETDQFVKCEATNDMHDSLPGRHSSFTAHIASMAALRSRQMNMKVDTFGDEQDSD